MIKQVFKKKNIYAIMCAILILEGYAAAWLAYNRVVLHDGDFEGHTAGILLCVVALIGGLALSVALEKIYKMMDAKAEEKHSKVESKDFIKKWILLHFGLAAISFYSIPGKL